MTDRPAPADDTHDLSHRLQADSVGRALSLVGERWTIMILRETFFGVRRYGQLARNLGIPRPTLSLRLRKLVDAGLLDRVLYSVDPERYEYRLTQAGRDLFPAVIALMRWGDAHLAGPEGPPIVLRHDTCGNPTHPHLTCDVCGEEINTHNVTPERGPGYAAAAPDAGRPARPAKAAGPTISGATPAFPGPPVPTHRPESAARDNRDRCRETPTHEDRNTRGGRA